MQKIDYGPLKGFIGTWRGDKGLDIAPEPDGTEENSYYETITFTPVGDVTNAEEQTLVALRYFKEVKRISDNKPIHDETGYFIWDSANSMVFQSQSIPRGVNILAKGSYTQEGSKVTLNLTASLDDNVYTITQSEFMHKKASTKRFEHTIGVDKDRLFYSELKVLDIYNKEFDHKDENILNRV